MPIPPKPAARTASPWRGEAEWFLCSALWTEGERVPSTYAVASRGVSSRAELFLRQRLGPCGRAPTARRTGRPASSGIARARAARGSVIVPAEACHHDGRLQPRDATVRIGFREWKCDSAAGFSVLARRQAATGRGLRLRPEIRPIARRRLAYRAPAGDVNPHAQGSRHPTRLCGGRRMLGSRIRCRALVASGARRQAGWSEQACHGPIALRATCASPVRDPTRQSARDPLHRAREVGEV